MDYGTFPMENGQLPNRDPETGIRYGIISANDLASWFWDVCEHEYSQSCPNCGSEWDEGFHDHDHDDAESVCVGCGHTFDDDESWSEEPCATPFADGECSGFVDSHNDVWVTWSKHTTRGRHCSPCAPGAVTIPSDGQSVDDGPECYTVPDSWLAINED